MINLSKLEEITDLRTVWAHEAMDFTPWLAKEENISLLADALGLEITVDETESPVGDFNVDIFASETGTSRKIIIENQLEDTNHDHLGKLITYASGKSADIIIWLVKHAREEHRAAIEWLNNHTDDKIGFFLCEIKLYHIGDSAPAVKFDVIEKPNDWTKEIRQNESLSETQQERYNYWLSFKEYALKNESFNQVFKRLNISSKTEIYPAMGTANCRMTISQVRKGKERPELEVYIRVWEETNFSALLENKDAIEAKAGLNFNWKEKGHRIIAAKQVNFDDKTAWNEHFDWLIDTMLKMKDVFKSYL